ncbi:hypothetical protein [Leptospira levettii]|nr:hypothetical protein [Leptospira levettii]
MSEKLSNMGVSEKSSSKEFANVTISGEFRIFLLMSQTWTGNDCK